MVNNTSYFLVWNFVRWLCPKMEVGTSIWDVPKRKVGLLVWDLMRENIQLEELLETSYFVGDIKFVNCCSLVVRSIIFHLAVNHWFCACYNLCGDCLSSLPNFCHDWFHLFNSALYIYIYICRSGRQWVHLRSRPLLTHCARRLPSWRSVTSNFQNFLEGFLLLCYQLGEANRIYYFLDDYSWGLFGSMWNVFHLFQKGLFRLCPLFCYKTRLTSLYSY